MATHVLVPADFRAMFPEFANPVTYPDAALQLQFTMATGFMGADDGPLLCDIDLQSALYYLTAHLMKSAAMLAAGQSSVVVKGSMVDRVQVTLEPPPIKTGWQWWLSTTPYGLTLWAFLSTKAAGGFYVGGRPEQAAFRKVGGRFW